MKKKTRAYLEMIYRIKGINLSDFGFGRSRLKKQVLIGLTIFTVTICFIIILPLILGFNKSDVLSFKPSSIFIMVFYIIHALFFVGPGEEIIFRGYFYREIWKVTDSELKAVIFSSILFGLWHFPNGHDIVNVFTTGFIGLIYGFVRYKIKNCTVLSTSIAHGVHDAVIVVLSYLLQ